MNAAYRNWFGYLKALSQWKAGGRNGPRPRKIGHPRFRSRKGARQAIRFTRYGRVFGKVGRFEPTSQVCSACGVKDGPKPLKIREWVCAACGAIHDRDVNAARNVLALGRRESLNACGGGVSPPATVAAAGEAGSLRGAA